MGEEFILRHPVKEDGLAVYRLIQSCPPLDLNSSYYYFVMCADFAQTSILAEQDGEVIAYISGYIPPEDEKTLFIWQVAVSEKSRGRGLAGKLLSQLVNQWSDSINALKTTISPSNKASQSLFTRFAEKRAYTLTVSEFLSADDFGKGEHEAEELYTIQIK